MSTKSGEANKKKEKLELHKAIEFDPALKDERIARTKEIQETLIWWINQSRTLQNLELAKATLATLRIEEGFHHIARMSVRDAIVQKQEELYK